MIDLDIKKSFPSTGPDAFEIRVTLTIEQGSFTAIFGKSGAGKTSVLRMIAGLTTPDQGHIKVNEQVWFDHASGISVSPARRKIAMLFQDLALFPNMTVAQNLDFAKSENAGPEHVEEIMHLLDIGKLSKRKPETLSGGEKQRVALGRALVQAPQVLLLDEPLSSIDPDTRSELQDYLLKVQKTYNLTTIIVSHDIPEVLKLTDRIIEMEQGKVIREGLPSEVLTGKSISGKFQLSGEIISIEKQDVIYLVSVIIGRELVRIVADEKVASELNPGDKVTLASKAFNPVIRKIG